MQKALLLLLVIIETTSNLFSQKNPTRIAGSVVIGNNISMKATEVTIQEWMSFIVNNNFDISLFPDSNKLSPVTKILFNDLRKTNDFEYLKIVNYKGWKKENHGSKGVYASKNFEHLTRNEVEFVSINKPITGVTFNQVQQFCTWKENTINAWQVTKVKVSLPSVKIYEKVITNEDSLNTNKCAQYNSINCHCQNERNIEDDKFQSRSLLRVDAYWPTRLGLYNLQGNAAEMTNVEGMAMGGSFRHYAIQSFSDRRQEYSSAEDWLGFRYVISLR
jgi:formylglycine-generating enzyme required for sulfatase activity